jgi:hypothetical protein
MKKNLNILERVLILGILRTDAVTKNVTTLKLVREVRVQLELNEEELKTSKITQDEKGNTTWNTEGIKIEKEINFSEIVEKIIIDFFKKMNDADTFEEIYLPLWDKFITE